MLQSVYYKMSVKNQYQRCLLALPQNYKIFSEKGSSGSKEHIKETKIADSVLLSPFMCSNIMVQHFPRPVAQASAELYFQTDSELAQ